MQEITIDRRRPGRSDSRHLLRRAGRRRCACSRRTSELGGRARSTDGPYKANLGPHALLSSSPFWGWLGERDLLPPYARPPLSGVRFRWRDDIRRVPAVGAAVAALRLRGRAAPVDLDFRTWAADRVGADAADALARSAGILTYHHDPGRAVGRVPVGAARPRAAVGAADRAVSDRRLVADRRVAAARALTLGVADRDRRAGGLASGGAGDHRDRAGRRAPLLGDESLTWLSGNAVCMDLALTHRRGDPFVVVDLQETGWVERYTAADKSLAPEGEELIQAQMPIRPGESADVGRERGSSGCSTRRSSAGASARPGAGAR